MNKTTLTHSKFLLVSLLFVLPGCGPTKEKPVAETVTAAPVSDGNVTLLSMVDKDGKQISLVTEQDLKQQLDMAAEANPQVKMVLEIMPDAEHDIFFKGLKRNKVLREWAKRNNIDEKAEYQRDFALLLDMARSSLDAQHFQKNLSITISDSDVKKYYDEHKDEMPGLVVSPAGVKVQGVMFDSVPKAEEFLEKVKVKGADFAKTAKEAGVEVDDFGGVLSDRSFVDATLKEKILAFKKFPTTELIKLDDKKVWVVCAKSKEKAQYVPYEQVKENLRSMLKEQELSKAFEKELEKLEKEYKFTENAAYFEAKKKKAEEDRKQRADAGKKGAAAVPQAEKKAGAGDKELN